MTKNEMESLSIKAIETIHVTHDEQKILSVAIVLKSTGKNAKFWETMGPLERLVVSDVHVTPNSEKVSLVVRNLTVKEIVELTREGVINPTDLYAELGDTLQALVSRKDDTSFLDAVEKSSETNSISLKDFWENVGPLTEVLLANVHVIPEINDLTSYKITIPLVDAHLAQVLYARSNSPSFVVVDEDHYKEMKLAQKENQTDILLSDFAILDYPFPSTTAYYTAVAPLIQRVEGYYPLNVTPERARELRGQALSLVVNLASGSDDALVRAFGYLNPVRNGHNAFVKRKVTGTSPLTQDNIDMVYFSECVARLYQYLEPSAVAAIIQQNEDNNDYYETASLVDDLFSDKELAESFHALLPDDDMVRLSENSTVEDIVKYYSAELNVAPGFPPEMMPLVSKINLPILMENDFMKASVTVEETSTNSGSLTIAKLIACAVRYNRLVKITEATSVSLNPIGCLVQGLTYTDELELWVIVESVRRLGVPGGLKMFKDIYTSGLTNPNLDEKFNNKAYLIESGLTNVLHRLGHVLISEFALEEALELLPSNDNLSHFVDAVYNPGQTEMELDDEASLCPPLESAMAVYDDIDFKFEGDEFVEAVGVYIAKLADAKAQEMFQNNSSMTRNDKGWREFVERWLTSLILPPSTI